MNAPRVGIHLYIELVASIKTTGIMINRLYTIRLRNFGIAFSRAICVIVKYFGKLLLKTVLSVQSSLVFNMFNDLPREIHNLKTRTVTFHQL